MNYLDTKWRGGGQGQYNTLTQYGMPSAWIPTGNRNWAHNMASWSANQEPGQTGPGDKMVTPDLSGGAGTATPPPPQEQTGSQLKPFSLGQTPEKFNVSQMGGGNQEVTGINFNNPLGGFGANPGSDWTKKKNLGFGGMFG